MIRFSASAVASTGTRRPVPRGRRPLAAVPPAGADRGIRSGEPR